MGLAAVADLLACPHCAGALQLDGPRLACPSGHSFDVARQGYVNLLSGPAPANADTATMVAARERFLAAGRYDPLLAALQPHVSGPAVLDAGAGPGWYLTGLLPPEARGLAADVSVAAIRRAARAHPRIGAVVADSWGRLPVRTAGVDTVLSIFAPRHPAEFARVLQPGGRLVVAAAEPDHLAELRERAGLLGVEVMRVEEGKQERLGRSLAEHFDIVANERVAFPLRLVGTALADLIGMGPNAFHREAGAILPEDPGPVTAAVRITVAQPRTGS